MNKLSLLKFIAAVVLFSLQSPYSASQTARDIIQKSEDILKGKSSYGKFRMTITTPEYSRKMEMESYWVGNEKALIIIKFPKREAGNKTLKIKNELWMYLRNTETTIKIPPSMMLQSWNGSDFTNDDLVRESNLVEDYDINILSEEIVNNEICWKIELTPKKQVAVVWGNIFYWVRKNDYLPARLEYFDDKGKLIRTLLYSDYKNLGGRIIPSRWTMINNIKTGHKTEFEIQEIVFDAKIDERIFSFKELEKGR